MEGAEAALGGGVGGGPFPLGKHFHFLAVVDFATAPLAEVMRGILDEGHVPLAGLLGGGVPLDLLPQKLDAVVAMRTLEHEFFLGAFQILLPDRAVGRGGRAGLDAKRADEGLRAVLGEEKGAGLAVGFLRKFIDLIHK